MSNANASNASKMPTFALLQLLFLSIFVSLWYVYSMRSIPARVPPNYNGNRMLDKLSQLVDSVSGFPKSLSQLDQRDPVLHKFIQFRHLTPPSDEPYNLPNGNDYEYTNFFSSTVGNMFKYKKNGTFIEAGAHDGVSASNTLYLEKSLGWNGLLVECNPVTVPFLKLKRRKAWIADVCLSQSDHPEQVPFSNPTKWTASAKIGGPVDLSSYGVETDWTQFEVTALPIYALIAAVELKEIDFFSLDVVGAEFKVLKTIPWDQVTIKVFLIEVDILSQEIDEMKTYMESKGYRLAADYRSDKLFVHSMVTL